MTYWSRPPQLPADLPALAELSAQSELVDQLDFPTSAEALAGILSRPGRSLDLDARLWYDDGGLLVGFGLLDHSLGEQVETLLWMRFLPAARSPQLLAELLGWGDVRLRARSAAHSLPAQLASGAGGADTWRIAQLEAHGLRPIRYFLRMERGLGQPIAPAPLPEGYSLRAVAGEAEAAAWADLYNQSFIDHWGHHPLSVEGLRAIWAEPLYRRDLDLVIVAPDGSLAAFCACELNPASPAGAGWIEVLGTRRGQRGRGLGRAILAAGMGRLRDAGASVAHLIVDAESLTGATRLYESVGFVATRRSVRLARSYPAPARP